ncbi:MAG: hypothetical protein Q7U57_12495 [Methylovulum sp.]|nr:hypothetical protein [Methylovulum sp.]
MTFKKRGLGRGLEVLLADTAAQGEAPTPLTIDHDGLAMSTTLLLENLHKEKLTILQEAEALKLLIDEFELIIRAGLQ